MFDLQKAKELAYGPVAAPHSVMANTLADAVKEIERLRTVGRDALEHDPFRNADEKDWDHLFKMIPASGHGQFWKAVLLEAKAALAAKHD